MLSEIANWNLKDWLEAGTYAVAIVGAVAGGMIFVVNSRLTSIEETRRLLTRTWTNEGDISSKETRYVTIKLEDYDGDLIGSLWSPLLDRPLEVHINVGWRTNELCISELIGRFCMPVATIQVRVTGNKNRLSWEVSSAECPSYLPPFTVLWPEYVGTDEASHRRLSYSHERNCGFLCCSQQRISFGSEH